MSILMRDPRGEVAKTQRKEEHKLDDLKGKKVGYIYNQHGNALVFWKKLEREIESRLNPAGVHRVYKDSTWRPAPQKDIDEVVQKTHYALVGVGA